MPNQQPFIKDFFVYQEDFTALAAGATTTASINIQADSAFYLQKMTYFADIASTIQTNDSRVIPLVSIQITDSGSGRQLIEAPAPVSSLFGTGEFPFILPTPKPFQPRATLTITVANFSASTTYNLRLSLIGYKAFYQGV